MAAEGMQSHDQSRGNCPTASHPATKKGRINATILPKPARCAKSDRLLGRSILHAGNSGLFGTVGATEGLPFASTPWPMTRQPQWAHRGAMPSIAHSKLSNVMLR